MIRLRSTRVLIVALAAFAILLTACSEDARTTASAENEAAASPPTQPEFSPNGWTPIPEESEGGLIPAGRLGMTANGRPDAPWAVIDVPEGFSTIGGWVIFDEDPKGGGGIGYWTISEVVRHPCRALSDANAIDAGNTPEQLNAAFDRQRLTRITEPVPVTVDGYQGLSFEVHVPKGIDFTTCPDYNVWESDPTGARHMQAPGMFDKLWMLDVEGEVVVLTVAAQPDDPKTSLDQLADMVESAEIIARD